MVGTKDFVDFVLRIYLVIKKPAHQKNSFLASNKKSLIFCRISGSSKFRRSTASNIEVLSLTKNYIYSSS